MQSAWYAQQSEKRNQISKIIRNISRDFGEKQNAVKDYLHKVTRWIAEYCRKEDIRCVVMGDIRNIHKEKIWDTRPTQKLLDCLITRCISCWNKLKLYGIPLIKQEESYTSSQCSPLSPEVSKRYAEAL